jgi:two-component system NarL family response regulator
MTDEVTVLVAVCSPPVREALVAMIGAQARFKIVAEACTHEEAVQLARLTRPLVALVDQDLPGYGGVWTVRSLLQEQLVESVVALGRRAEDGRCAEAAGAQAFVQIGVAPTEVMRSLEQVVRRRPTVPS